ncbi:MAG: response regulator [Clostridia bacterium]|nr:response regulator [Clostridia bacterium]
MMTYKFIFVDDEELLRKNLPYMTDWNALGFEFSGSFSSASEAMKYIEQNKVDLVLSDIRLGEESGLDLAEKLDNEYPRILVVLISAYKEFEYAKKAIECHVFSYLTKPTSYDDIIELFNNAKKELDSQIFNIELKKSQNSEHQASKNSIDKAISYINEHFTEDITREHIANFLEMNPEYFSRFFKKHTGKKMVDYVNELRIGYAKRLLSETDMKIYEVCTKCCYKSMHYFLALFKQYTNMTPNEYRAIHFRNEEEGSEF